MGPTDSIATVSRSLRPPAKADSAPPFPVVREAKKRRKAGGLPTRAGPLRSADERSDRQGHTRSGPASSDSSTRLSWLRRILLASCFFGMLACWRLWESSRQYPAVPVTRWFPALEPPWDRIFFGALLLSLIAALKFWRPAVIVFLAGVGFLVLGDQNRIQPWFYMYVVMLFLTLMPVPAALAGCRVVLSAVYFWSGVQKFNQSFFDSVVPWFVEPARRWLPPEWVAPIGWLVASAGAVELFIGIALWIPAFRRAAVVTAVFVHAAVLILLGPLGRNYNLVVWPWNIAMPLLALVLFWPRKIPRTLPDLKMSRTALVTVVLFAFLPGLSYVGLWDSALSFCVYSGNTAKLTLFVSPALRDRLPARIRRFTVSTEQGDLKIDLMSWGLAELGVPPLGEPRSFRAAARYVAQFAPTDHDVHLIVAPRFGPIEEYRQSDLR